MGQLGLGAWLPTWEPNDGGGAGVCVGAAFPSRGDRDSVNWKGLELQEQEGGRGKGLPEVAPLLRGEAGLPRGDLPGVEMGP